MRLACSLVLLTAVISAVMADYNFDFCKKRMNEIPNATTQGSHPVFYDNFYVFIEEKLRPNRTVSNIAEHYSQAAGLLYAYITSVTGINQVWVDANTDELLLGGSPTEVCTDTPLEGSDYQSFLGISSDGDHLSLGLPDVALGWNKKLQKELAYKGEDSARGIDTFKWFICSYDPAMDITLFSEFHIANPEKIELPVVNPNDPFIKPILPVMSKVTTTTSSASGTVQESMMRFDLTHFGTITPNDPSFQTPTTMLCQAKPSTQKPLPIIPSYFKFKGEQVTIPDYFSTPQGTPNLVFTVESYLHALGIFVQDYVRTPSQPNGVNDKSYTRTINDYNMGITFKLDLNAGTCDQSVIDPQASPDTIPLAGGLVQMRNSQQFFDLDSKQYQYMGIHTLRGIDCDTWSVFFVDGSNYHIQNALYTWYFANPDWLKNRGYTNYTAPLPVALEVTQSSSYTLFNIYEYDTLDGIEIPDLSLCFLPSTTINVELFISARYDIYVSYNYDAFAQAFYVALMAQTRIGSSLRLADFDAQPATNDETVIRFKLLDFAAIPFQGDVNNPVTMTINTYVYNDLVKAVDSGKFSMDIEITIAGSSALQGTKTVYARPGSVGTIVSESEKFVAAPSPKNDATTFSAGAMAGIAFGMLLGGLLIGALIVFVVQKIRGGSETATNIDLSNLGHSDS